MASLYQRSMILARQRAEQEAAQRAQEEAAQAQAQKQEAEQLRIRQEEARKVSCTMCGLQQELNGKIVMIGDDVLKRRDGSAEVAVVVSMQVMG